MASVVTIIKYLKKKLHINFIQVIQKIEQWKHFLTHFFEISITLISISAKTLQEKKQLQTKILHEIKKIFNKFQKINKEDRPINSGQQV